MSLTTSEMTPADIAAVTRNNDGMFGGGGDGAWWLIILLLFGWGGRGFGFGGGGYGGGVPATQADLAAGFNNSAVLSGINGIDAALCQGFNGINTAILQGVNSLERQFADCCCGTQRAIDGVNYNLATQACAIQNTISSTTRDVIENANANSRAILDAINANYIRTLESENASLKLSASQASQNAVLMAAMDANKAEILRRTGAECPTAAYVVQPPRPVTFPNFGGCGGCNGFAA